MRTMQQTRLALFGRHGIVEDALEATLRGGELGVMGGGPDEVGGVGDAGIVLGMEGEEAGFEAGRFLPTGQGYRCRGCCWCGGGGGGGRRCRSGCTKAKATGRRRRGGSTKQSACSWCRRRS